MVPAKPRDTITQFLREVERAAALKTMNVRCQQVLVEDHYEIDERYSVEECLGDMQRVLVIASAD